MGSEKDFVLARLERKAPLCAKSFSDPNFPLTPISGPNFPHTLLGPAGLARQSLAPDGDLEDAVGTVGVVEVQRCLARGRGR